MSDAGYGLQDFQDYILTVLDLNEEYEGTGKAIPCSGLFSFQFCGFQSLVIFPKVAVFFLKFTKCQIFNFFCFAMWQKFSKNNNNCSC